MNAVLQYVLYVGILVAISVPLGIYMSRIMDGEPCIVSRVLGPVERGIYKLLRIDPNENMSCCGRESMCIPPSTCSIWRA